MAETPEENPTPEETPEAPAAEAPDTEAPAADEAPATEAGGDASSEPESEDTTTTDEPAAAPAPSATRRDRLEARRDVRRKERASRGPRTVEDRIAEREERKATNAKQRRAYRAKQKEKAAARRAAEPPREPDHAVEHAVGRPKVRQGVVTSDKADKTITVRIDITRRHRRYNKILRTSSKLSVHDEANDANEGDTVRVIECRPLSRTKRWRLVEVLERAK